VFADLLRQYRRDNEVVPRMRRSGTFAISEGRESWNDMVDVWIECQDKFVADEADRVGLSRDDKTRKDAALWIAGYAYAHLDVNQNRRLWKEMGPGGRVDRQRRLAQALPGAVFAAWFDGPVYGDVRRLPLEAARILGGDGERKRRPTSKEPDLSYGEIDRKVRRAGLLPDPIPDVDPTSIPQRRGMGPSRAERRRNATRERAELREFQSRELGERFAVGDFEWIEAVNNLKHESGLSDREANVAHACAEYPNLRTGQIGAALGIAEGTVRAHRSRIRSRIKVRRA
jgi:DNA-binding CsgD family transcriptional regulator